ncbi:MAG TPA: glycosyltransferase family 39 protein [Candidatus Acidoferrales bacterium]|nr:glycosyltransferase family 39 protein [Candidatus Acidoferrales bacterium]
MNPKLVRVVTSLWLILLAAAGLRFGYAWHEQRKIPSELLVARFQQETGNIAYSLATGKGFSSPWLRESGPTAYLAPVYPLLLAGIFRIFGIETIHSFFATASLNIVFSVATCVPIFYAGKRIVGSGVASTAAWFWALLPNAVIFPFEWVWDTSLSALLAATLLWAALAVAESPRSRRWCAYGLLWGFALLTNPALGSLLPFLIGWAGYRAQDPRFLRLQRLALAVGCAILCCVPWTVRNYAIFHKFVPLRSSLGLELYIENNENYGNHPRVWPYNITREREVYRFFRMGESAFMDEEMHKALQFIFSHPRAELRLCSYRFVSFWMGTPDPLQDFFASDSLFLRTVFLASFLLLLGTLAGIVVLFRKHDGFAFPLASFPVIFPLIYYITHASLRYRHSIDPILVLLSAIAAATALHQLVHRRDKNEDKYAQC